MPKQEYNTFPAQHQNRQPGSESEMNPQPIYDNPAYKSAGKLLGKRALITGGDSGIGRAVAVAFAKEGADVGIIYLSEQDDADKTGKSIENLGQACVKIKADLRDYKLVEQVANQAISDMGGIDILINNAGVQYPQNSILDITNEQLIETFETNIFAYFHLTKAVLGKLKSGCAIINTTSITAFEGNATLIDYSSTKGAIVSFTRSLALSLVEKGIRVNAVAPGPVWTPLITSSYSPQKVQTFGSTSPMGRAAQPYELAPIYVYLASDDSSNVTGQIFHVNGGTVIN